MAETKNFKWRIYSIDLVPDTIHRPTTQVTLRLDVLGAPGTRASFMDLRNDIMTRFNGVSAIFPEIKNVIFNPPATIILWADNTKTVVKCQEGDEYDPEKGLAMAIVKKMYGNTGKYCEIFKKWIKEEDEECDYPEITIDCGNANFKAAIEKIQKAAKASTMSMVEAANAYCSTINNFAEKEAAKTRAEKLEKETGWIAVTYKLPCEKGDYLVYDTFTESAYVYEYDNTSLNDVIYWQRHITHWMPVPAAPKKGE